MEKFKLTKEHLATYKETDIVFKDGRGARLFTEKGREYINMNDISCILGYGHEKFNEAIVASSKKLLAHGSGISQEKEKLIANLMEATRFDFDKLFFASSGGEVVDYALKIARRATGKDGIVTYRGSLHGRSFAGAYISDTPLRKEGFGSGLEHVYFWDFPQSSEECFKDADNYKDIAAIIVEPYQAIGGMYRPSKKYWKWLKEYTRKNNIVLIFDEIQTGFGKTGDMFAYTSSGIVPDILLLGKGMSNGFGLGALLMSDSIYKHLKPEELSGGSADNDFMCSIVNSIFTIFKEDELLERVKEVSVYLKEGIYAILNELGLSAKLNGEGLFLSLMLEGTKAGEVQKFCAEKGVLFGKTSTCLLIRPPLVLNKSDVKEALIILKEALKEKCR